MDQNKVGKAWEARISACQSSGLSTSELRHQRDIKHPDQVYLACGSTDLRKSIDGLAVLVKEGFDLGILSPLASLEAKAFCN